MLHFVTSYMKHNKSRKQTLESAQYGLEISFNLCFASGSLISITGHPIGAKNSVNCVGKLSLRSGKESFGFKKLFYYSSFEHLFTSFIDR